jgi:hypothetical protein
MADVFVSYAREDEARIQPLVRALADRGWSVFWDRKIPAGQTWRGYIGQSLGDARCVIVAWSSHSIASSWVSEEADEGKQRGILVPVLLDPVEAPIGFRSIQAADLSEWQSGEQSPRLEQFLRDVEAVLRPATTSRSESRPVEGVRDVPEPPREPTRSKPKDSPRRLLLALWAAVFVAVAAGGYWTYGRYYNSSPAAAYLPYQNKRIGYSISYPVNLLSPQAESADGTSQRFVSRDGRALLVATGATGRSTADLRDLYERQSRGATPENPTRVVTYRVKRENWFVVSGYEQSRIWYEKTIASGDTLATFRLEYDEAQRQLYDPVAASVAASFAIRPEGQQ